MADPEAQALRAGPELISGAAIPFRFEITWRSLTQSLEPTGAASLERISTLPARRAPARDTEAKEWEMVLPRMKRRVTIAPAIAAAPNSRPVAAPHFAVESSGGSRGRFLLMAGIPALLFVIFALVHWTNQASSPDEPVAPAMDMGSAGWTTEWASDRTGSMRGRQMSLYRP